MPSTTRNWGPSHQHTGRRRYPVYKRAILGFVALCVAGALTGGTRHETTGQVIFGLAICGALAFIAAPRWLQRATLIAIRTLARLAWPAHLRPHRRQDADPLTRLRAACTRAGGIYLGLLGRRERYSRPQRAVLILGPPRSGKSTGVIIPALIAHPGPAVSTSTKPDVATRTANPRARHGRLWVFDPTGTQPVDPSAQLRWSPVTTATSWDAALLTARAMTATVGTGTTDRSHWAQRAQALLAALLHAAAIHHHDMSSVVRWVSAHDLDTAGTLLEDERCHQLAFNTLLGLHNTEARERSSIFSATADALQAYTHQHTLTATEHPNFDPDAFARSQDTVYIYAPAEDQAAVAPIVCGLLSEIRRATYHAHATGQLTARMLFALDEVANIAPLLELPQIASEGGGQGLTLLAALQDLSQARHRWGQQADGFLTLFGTKLILPGVADTQTLEAISTMLGDYDRQVISHNHPQTSFLDRFDTQRPAPHHSITRSTQRTRVLPAGDVAAIPAGHALHLDATDWELLTLTPAHATEPWRTLTTIPADTP